MEPIGLDEIIEKSGLPLREEESEKEYIDRIGREAEVPPEVRERIIEVMNKSLYAPDPTFSEEERAAVKEFRSHLDKTTFEPVRPDEPHETTVETDDQRTQEGESSVEEPDEGALPDGPDEAQEDRHHGRQTDTAPVQSTSPTSYTAQRSRIPRRLTNFTPTATRRTIRLALLALITLTIIPIVAMGIGHEQPQEVSSQSIQSSQDIAFVSVQGGETGFGAGVYAIDRDTDEIVWKHTDYFRKYFDLDPLNDEEILFIAQINTSATSFRAIRMNWRTGEINTSFQVPRDTHDVDYIGNGTYVVADKHQHRIYEYRPESDEILWEFSFPEHFPPTAGDGIENDYTHLNDVDLVQNGTAYLVSPREFDRIFLIDRSTKEVVWTLGEQDNETIIQHQHNPVLLSSEPPVVLVADSNNNRVIEYKRTDDGWQRTWLYDNWPWTGWARDADRLPNGNTLIVGSGQDRLLEVTPAGEIVWRMDISNWAQGPYDIELLRFGDEPAGPPMDELRQESVVISSDEEPSTFDAYYGLARWVLPPWITKQLFLSLHATGILVIVWALFELRWVLNRHRSGDGYSPGTEAG